MLYMCIYIYVYIMYIYIYIKVYPFTKLMLDFLKNLQKQLSRVVL